MIIRDGRFRVYRVTKSVPHLNLQAVESPVLYTVYQQGYTNLWPTVDDLRTGDRIQATLSDDPEADNVAWRLEALNPVDSVEMGFAADADPPALARDCWTPGRAEPECAVLTEDGTHVGACCVQPREPLPGGRFVPNVLAGLLPIESQLSAVTGVGDPAVKPLFIDPYPPGARNHTTPFGVVILFTEQASDFPDRFGEAYDCPWGTDTRLAFDPYGL